jgi:hypothetical protein
MSHFSTIKLTEHGDAKQALDGKSNSSKKSKKYMSQIEKNTSQSCDVFGEVSRSQSFIKKIFSTNWSMGASKKIVMFVQALEAWTSAQSEHALKKGSVYPPHSKKYPVSLENISNFRKKSVVLFFEII